MKYTTLVLLLILSLTLTACGKQQDEQSVPNTPTPKVEPTKKAQVNEKTPDQAKADFEAMAKKHKTPKVATLKNPKMQAKGKVFLQYDKKEDQSYLWLKVNAKALDKSSRYTVWLMNPDNKEEKKEINLGQLVFLDDETALLSYTFAEKGNYYPYHRLEIVKGNESSYEKSKFELFAVFSKSLSSL